MHSGVLYYFTRIDINLALWGREPRKAGFPMIGRSEARYLIDSPPQPEFSQGFLTWRDLRPDVIVFWVSAIDYNTEWMRGGLRKALNQISCFRNSQSQESTPCLDSLPHSAKIKFERESITSFARGCFVWPKLFPPLACNEAMLSRIFFPGSGSCALSADVRTDNLGARS